jgi:hypothetical protein
MKFSKFYKFFTKKLKNCQKIVFFLGPEGSKTTKRKNVGRFTIYLRKPQKRPFLGLFWGILTLFRVLGFFGVFSPFLIFFIMQTHKLCNELSRFSLKRNIRFLFNEGKLTTKFVSLLVRRFRV